MAGRRIERLNEQLKREIAAIVRHEVKDPRVGPAAITAAEVTPDLALARIYVSVAGGESEKAQTLEGLRAAAAFIRGELGRRLRIRRTPELHFELDRALEHALRIERLLQEMRPDRSGGPDSSNKP
ncbi:MAG: 30S ribosome-binding factor RbfA [Gemmatimonadetes bacterium]|nr:30S ribosome-binding factor RbfA [Gemmatimonadota bacterium]